MPAEVDTPLSPALWRRLRPLLEQAQDLSEEAQARFLAALAPEQIELRPVLQRLLQRARQPHLLDTPVVAELAARAVASCEVLVAAGFGSSCRQSTPRRVAMTYAVFDTPTICADRHARWRPATAPLALQLPCRQRRAHHPLLM